MAMRRRRASRSPAIARSAKPNGCDGEYVEACPEDLGGPIAKTALLTLGGTSGCRSTTGIEATPGPYNVLI